METNKLSINQEVIEKMAIIAAKEVEGVAGMAQRSVDIKGAVAHGKLLRSVKATEKNGAVIIDLYIKIKDGVKAKDVAENVQANVKEKLQSMTGNAITRVNVIVADLETDTKEEKK